MRIQGSHLILPLYAAAALLLTVPTGAKFSTSIPSSRAAFDPGLQAFLIGWDWHALTRDPLRVFDAPIFHPEPRTLAYMDHMLGETAAAAPVLWLTGSVAAAYNILVLLSFAFSAWAAYRLVRLFGVSRLGAGLSGFLFAFGPYRYANLDLLNQLQTQFLPLGLFFAVRYLQRWKVRDAVGVAAAVIAQIYFGWYYAYYLVAALALLVGYKLVQGSWHAPRGHRRAYALIAALSFATVAPVTWPYVERRLELPEFRRSLGETALYSADLLDYLKTNPTSVLAGAAHLPTGAQAYFPGLVVAALGALGASALWARRRLSGAGISPRRVAQAWGDAGYFLLLAPAAMLLSLGPILHVAGVRLWIPLPYSVLYFLVPGFSVMRAPARLAVLALLACVVLAGIGFKLLETRLRERRPFAWKGMVAAMFGIAVLGAWVRPVTLLELPSSRSMPGAYAWLARQPDKAPILELPAPARDADENETHALRQYWILLHGHPRLDGCSGFVSRRYRAFRAAVQSFPSDEALRAAAGMGARWIVVHYGDYPAGQGDSLRDRIESEPRLDMEARFGNDVVYELRSEAAIR